MFEWYLSGMSITKLRDALNEQYGQDKEWNYRTVRVESLGGCPLSRFDFLLRLVKIFLGNDRLMSAGEYLTLKLIISAIDWVG